MTDVLFAIAGEPHATLPEGVADWQAGVPFAVVSWHCPQCEQIVAQTVVRADRRLLTVLTSGPAVHVADADRDGLRYLGPSRRAMRGKTPRKSVDQLSTDALLRQRATAGRHRGYRPSTTDYSPIGDESFDTICTNCPLRVRISMLAP